MQSLVSLRGVAAGLDSTWLGVTLGLASGSLGLVLDMPSAQFADDRGKLRIVAAGLACFLVASACLLAGGKLPLLAGAFLAGLVRFSPPRRYWPGSARPRRSFSRPGCRASTAASSGSAR